MRGSIRALAVHGAVRFVVRCGGAGSRRIIWTVDDTPIYSFAADGGGLVIVERYRASDTTPSSFTVRRIGVSGDTVFSRSYAYDPIQTPANAAPEVAELLVERMDRGEGLLTVDRVERELRWPVWCRRPWPSWRKQRPAPTARSG